MRKIKLLKVAFLCALVTLMTISFAKAQTATPHVFHVNTRYMSSQLDSISRVERNKMLAEYHAKVTMKNEFILHTSTMTHFFSEDSREFVTVDEYASWGDIEKAFTRDDELAKMAWPDAKQRQDFMNKMNSYFSHHKDAVYNGLPSLMK